MAVWLDKVNAIVWGGPTLIMILLVGLLLTVCTKGAQFRLFPKAISRFFNMSQSGSSKRALYTALAATVGTGNLAGVAGAIAIGGPGVLFWMWICAFGGMVLKLAEATLSVRFQCRSENGEIVGGPMYVIRNAMGGRWRFLAAAYSFFGVVAALGVGNATQVNTIITSVNQVMVSGNSDIVNILLGVGIGILVGVVFTGGAKNVGILAERLVPMAAAVYIVLCVGVILLHWERLPEVFGMIFKGAFDPKAITGGAVASAFVVLRVGVSRGVFTNEAGMGTAGIAHGSANVSHPVEQGLMGIVEVFLDTIVICTLTGFVILCSGIDVCYGEDRGIQLTMEAFSSVYGPWVNWVIMGSVCCFAFATILGWGLYGGRCAQYLLGVRAWNYFVVLQVIAVVVGAVLGTGIIWVCAEIVNGLMALPCLISLTFLTPELIKILREYKYND